MKINIRREPLRRIETARRVAPNLSRTPAPVARMNATLPAQPIRDVPLTNPLFTATDAAPDPYVDYARMLTHEGGIAMIYKDIDQRLRHTLLRILLWSIATGWEAWILFHHRPPLDPWLIYACLLAVALVNGFIVAKPIQIYRRIEIRPDCMILDGGEIFWRHKMEGAVPAFRADAGDKMVFCGTYGTRFVEYLTVRRFDELDRTPEVLAAHLQDAMQQLWSWPY